MEVSTDDSFMSEFLELVLFVTILIVKTGATFLLTN